MTVLASATSLQVRGLTEIPPIAIKDAGEAWQEIDAKLYEWLSNRQDIVDCDAIPPSRDTIMRARSCIARLRQLNQTSPDMVAPDGNGGITFEWNMGTVFRILEITRDADPVLSVFVGNRRVFREPIDLGC